MALIKYPFYRSIDIIKLQCLNKGFWVKVDKEFYDNNIKS